MKATRLIFLVCMEPSSHSRLLILSSRIFHTEILKHRKFVTGYGEGSYLTLTLSDVAYLYSVYKSIIIFSHVEGNIATVTASPCVC